MDQTTLTHNFQAIGSTCKAIEALGFRAYTVQTTHSRKNVFLIQDYPDIMDSPPIFFARFDTGTGVLSTVMLRVRKYDSARTIDFMTRLSLMLTAAYKPVAASAD